MRYKTVLLSILCTLPLLGRAQASAPLFTEGFESGTINGTIWSQQISGTNSISVQNTKAAHGSYSLLVRCPDKSNKTWAFISASKIPAALRQHHFGRAYVFIPTPPPLRHTIFIMSGTPGFPYNRFQEIATANGNWQLTYVDLSPNGNKEDYHAGSALPVGRWFCLEWEFNDQPNHTAIWIDGKPVYETDFTVKATGQKENLVAGFTDYAFGFRLWGDALAPFDIYYDDIALNTARIGQLP